MQTLSQTNNVDQFFSNVGRELTMAEVDEVSGGSYELSLGSAVSLVIGGAALASTAPLIAGALVLGSIGASGIAIWHSLMRK